MAKNFFFQRFKSLSRILWWQKIHLMREVQYIYPEQSEYSINIASNIRRKRKKIYEGMTHANIHAILGLSRNHGKLTWTDQVQNLNNNLVHANGQLLLSCRSFRSRPIQCISKLTVSVTMSPPTHAIVIVIVFTTELLSLLSTMDRKEVYM